MPLLKLGAVHVECEQQGAGQEFLLLHSLLTEMTVFDAMLPRLSGQVTRINLPGFGASTPVELTTVAAHADPVARVLHALKLPSDTTVFGNGFGSFVALELAIRHGKRFGKLIVADTLTAFPEKARVPFRIMAEKVSAGGMQAVLDTAIDRMFPPAFAQAHPDIIAERKTKLSAVDPQCFARACTALASLNLSANAANIENSTLVMCGALDQTTPPALARELSQRIKGSRYAEIPDSGHCPMLEQPDILAEHFMAFASDQRRTGLDMPVYRG